MFKSTCNKGFQITFQNGYTVSCQFGATNYCERYSRHFDSDYRYNEEMSQEIISSSDCEVGIWDAEDNWVTSKVIEAVGMDSTEDMIQANVTPEDVAKILTYVTSL